MGREGERVRERENSECYYRRNKILGICLLIPTTCQKRERVMIVDN